MPGIIGKKIGMTSVFGPEGENIACTVIEAGPCVVTQVKNRRDRRISRCSACFWREEKNTHQSRNRPFQESQYHSQESR